MSFENKKNPVRRRGVGNWLFWLMSPMPYPPRTGFFPAQMDMVPMSTNKNFHK